MDKSIASKDGTQLGAASLASLSFEILGELLDEIILDVVAETHRDVKNMRSICPVFVRVGLDIFGQSQNPKSSQDQSYECVHCQRPYPALRYAPHLEKCMGLAGRTSSRTASRRMGAGERAGSGSPFTPVSYSDDREASDSDKDLLEKKRRCHESDQGKKNASSINGHLSNGNSIAGSNGGGDYGTPNSIKSSSSGSTKVKKQKQGDSSDFPSKPQKQSSLLAKASKGSSSTKLKGLGLHTPSAVSTPRAQTPVGEIALGYLEDNLLLANGRSLQNGSGGSGNNTGSSTPQKLSSSNPKRASGGVSSSKRPPGSSHSSKNGQVISFYDSLKAIGSRDGTSSSDAQSSDDDDEERSSVGGGGLTHSSSQPIHPVVHRLKKSSAFSGHASDSIDTDFIDIDGDEEDDSMDVMQSPKKKKS
ncbi:Ataxin-7-like protein 3 [Haplosporangium sp. Z 767]|nr:Ataxin-7-like protein 3 [Haplosporangium sp. Z 767]